MAIEQQKQVDDFRSWLTNAEDEISKFSEIGCELDEVVEQLEHHKKLYSEVVEQQANVESLSDLILSLSHEEEDEALADDLQDQLLALREKWFHVCQFVEERGHLLEHVVSTWRMLEEEEERFNQWMHKLDKRLTEMEDATAETIPGSEFANDLVKRLQKMEKEMEIHHVYYSRIVEEGDKLLEKLGENEPSSTNIMEKLYRLASCWDAIIQRMDNLGFEVTRLSEEQAAPEPDEEPEVDDDQEQTEMEASTSKEGALDNPAFEELEELEENTKPEVVQVSPKKLIRQTEVDKSPSPAIVATSSSKSVPLSEDTHSPLSSPHSSGTSSPRSCPDDDDDDFRAEVSGDSSSSSSSSSSKADKPIFGAMENPAFEVKSDDDEDTEPLIIKNEPQVRPSTPVDTSPKSRLAFAKSMLNEEASSTKRRSGHRSPIHEPRAAKEAKPEDVDEQPNGIEEISISSSSKADVPPEVTGSNSYSPETSSSSPTGGASSATSSIIFPSLPSTNETLLMEIASIAESMKERSELNGKDYEEFGKQEAALRSLKDKLDSLKIRVEAELTENDESNLASKWTALRERFMQRHRRWWRARELLQKFETSLKAINSWLDGVETLLSASRSSDGDLDLEVARTQYDQLRLGFRDHVVVYGTVRVLCGKVVAQCARPDGVLLREQLSAVHSRWQSVVRELAWRRERVESDGNNMNILARWTDLRDFVVASERAILATRRGEIREFEQTPAVFALVKELEAELAKQWLNMMSVLLAAPLLNKDEVLNMDEKFAAIQMQLPEARIQLEGYLSTVRIVRDKLSSECEWAEARLVDSSSATIESTSSSSEATSHGKTAENLNSHETTFEQLVVMLAELESDSKLLGHELPSTLYAAMNKLKLRRSLLKNPRKMDGMSDSKQEPLNVKAIVRRPSLDGTSNGTNGSLHSMSSRNGNSTQQQQQASTNHQLLLSLRELMEWVIKKEMELNGHGHSIPGESNALSKQRQEHALFVASLNEKKPLLERNLLAGRQLIAGSSFEDTMSTPSSNDTDVKSFEDDGSKKSSSSSENVQRAVRWEVKKLSDKWFELLGWSDKRTKKMDDVQKKLSSLEVELTELTSKVQVIEERCGQNGVSNGHQDGILETQLAAEHLNESVARLSGANVLLAHSLLSRLDELNTRVRRLGSGQSVPATSVKSSTTDKPFLSTSDELDDFLSHSVEHPWERGVAANRVPYFIDHATETTHWDHPAMSELINSLSELNEVRYSAYRTAMKLRRVQRRLALDLVNLETLVKVFDERGLRAQNEKLLHVPEMIACLKQVYDDLGKQSAVISIPLCIDLCLNWILNLFDTSTRTGYVRVLAFKIGLVTLSKAPIEEKYQYMFRLIADTRGFTDERKLALLLHDLVQVPRLLGEIAAFGGSNIEPSVRSCFERSAGKRHIDATDFLDWLQQEPQSVVWLPLLHRLITSESAKHQAKCNVCKAFPIHGLRYRCLKCFNLDLCQGCFFAGRTLRAHKATHPMQEYCTTPSSGADVRDFSRIIRNKFKSKRYFRKHPRVGYLPVQSVLEGDELQSPGPQRAAFGGELSVDSMSSNVHSKLEMYATRLAAFEQQTPSRLAEPEDEHQLIAQYAQTLSLDGGDPQSPAQVMAAIDAEQRDELEALIHELEDENRLLQSEYESLKASSLFNGGSLPGRGYGGRPMNTSSYVTASNPLIATTASNSSYGDHPSSMMPAEDALVEEASKLRQHKGRLEARMEILEDHNVQLENHLQRLRHLLETEPSDDGLLLDPRSHR